MVFEVSLGYRRDTLVFEVSLSYRTDTLEFEVSLGYKRDTLEFEVSLGSRRDTLSQVAVVMIVVLKMLRVFCQISLFSCYVKLYRA